MREDYYAGLEDRYFLTFNQAKERRKVIDFDESPPAPAPGSMGVTVIDGVKIADIVKFIDWVSIDTDCSSERPASRAHFHVKSNSFGFRTRSSKPGS
jgi:cobalamin-dependent methionine synthase I